VKKLLAGFALVAIGVAGAVAPAAELTPCRIDVTDEASGWPVPLVELRTTHNARFVSDNAGIIAFDLPELMGVETWFSIEGHGYGVKKDGFGNRGVRLTPEPGGRLGVKVRRMLPAKRLGRITGAGIFGESQKLGLQQDWKEQGILGCDSVQNAVHDGRLWWAWGDTNLARYPLGLFHMIGATTELQPLPRFEPPVKLRYDYFVDGENRPRVIAKMPGKGPTWIRGCISLPGKDGESRLVACYDKIEAPLTTYETGLLVWNDQESRFDRHRVLWHRDNESRKLPPTPVGHPVLWKDEAGKEWALFGDPFPELKCEATFEAWDDPEEWELLEPQKSVPAEDGGEEIKPHRGSIAWNEFRRKWVAVFTQRGGEPSYLGEIWYAEADSPFGPWGGAVKVVTHANYTFYNPRLHPEFSGADSPVLLFEGTYTRTFAKQAEATPRHDYNQVLYRLDLDDPALIR
jgi:hypothetical protein